MIQNSNQNSCDLSLSTLERVSKCPSTTQEVQEAKQRKRCDILAGIQTCVPPSNFTYHCVINYLLNETYEVCASVIYSQGHCIEFNRYGKVIQELQEIDCTRFGCPKRFRTSDILEYSNCSKLVEYKKAKTGNYGIQNSTTYPNNKEMPTPKTTSEGYKYATFILIAAIILILIPLIYFAFRYTRQMKGTCTATVGKEEYKVEIAMETLRVMRKEKQHQNPNDAMSLRTISPASAASTGSTANFIPVAEGYGPEEFNYLLQTFALMKYKESFDAHGIDSVVAFIDLEEERMKDFGWNYGQRINCASAIQELLRKKD